MADERDMNFYRNEVLDAHLLLEDNVNTLLEMAFQIKLPPSLSNNYSKLDLLLDLGIIEEDFRESFQLFSQIRNQFIHVLGCYRFTDLPERHRKKLLASQKKSYDYLEDNEVMFEALKALFKSLMEGFMTKVNKAMVRGLGDKADVKRLEKRLSELIEYICEKYPDENRQVLTDKFLR